MEFLLNVFKKLKEVANKCQVKHVSCSLEPSVLFNSFVNMVDSEGINLKKIKSQQLSLGIISLFDIFHQNVAVKDNPSESQQIHAEDPNNESILLFC